MISIIVCSRKPDIPAELRQNISDTIGCDYELVVIDNSHNLYNIFQAYNEGVRRAKGDILCFMHDDILFHSENWGEVVRGYFGKCTKLGCLGVAGSHLLLDTPSSFWHSEANIFHFSSRDGSGNLGLIDTVKHGKEKSLIQVASVDGLWMCMRSNLFETIRFDDVTYKGFHCYDSDICMQVLQAGYDIGIAYEVIVEHNKIGTQNASYFESISQWHRKWTSSLPVVRGAEFSEDDIAARTALVKDIVYLEEQVAKLQGVRDSKAYRLGKFLLKPFS